MQVVVLIKCFAGLVVVTQLIYTTVSREITRFTIAVSHFSLLTVVIPVHLCRSFTPHPYTPVSYYGID